MGKAYGFFSYNGLISEIESEIPSIREFVKTPSELELKLTDGMNNVVGDEGLVSLAKNFKNVRYMLEATYPNHGNLETSSYLGDILNGIACKVHEEEGEVFVELAYESDGKYVLID